MDKSAKNNSVKTPLLTKDEELFVESLAEILIKQVELLKIKETNDYDKTK